ncbi:DUF1707 SHOCT-like domain-containing protein [Subtercola lobariae]|nr:DUF1707 domain-containing protein [Subtercola lobariae]
MTDFSDPQTAHVRLTNSERDEAVAQLNANLREGRLDEAEFVKRSAAVRSAVTRGDLAPLFNDLPVQQPHASTPPPQQPYAAPPTSPSEFGAAGYGPPSIHSPGDSGSGRRGPLGGAVGTVAVSISPFVALILFLITGALGGWTYSWLWFLLVPITAIIVYAGGTRDSGRNRYR